MLQRYCPPRCSIIESLGINRDILQATAALRLNRIRAELRSGLSAVYQEQTEILDSAASSLKGVLEDVALPEYRAAYRESQVEGERLQKQIVHKFLADYVDVLVLSGNQPADIAAAMHTEVREAFIGELSPLGKDLRQFVTDRVLYVQEARSWGLAEEAEGHLNGGVSQSDPAT